MKSTTGFHRSLEYSLNPAFRDLIVAKMKQDGRNFRQCELCGSEIPPKKFNIHHTRYEGATYQDLLIVCAKCNHATENVGLA